MALSKDPHHNRNTPVWPHFIMKKSKFREYLAVAQGCSASGATKMQTDNLLPWPTGSLIQWRPGPLFLRQSCHMIPELVSPLPWWVSCISIYMNTTKGSMYHYVKGISITMPHYIAITKSIPPKAINIRKTWHFITELSPRLFDTLSGAAFNNCNYR